MADDVRDQGSTGIATKIWWSRFPGSLRSGNFLTGTSGASAVEFAIIAPVFLLLFSGMVAYGIYLGTVHSIQQLAADAARTAIAGINTSERQFLAQRFIDRNASGYPLVDGQKLTVNVRDSVDDHEQFMVTIRYDASGLPIWSLYPLLPSQTIERTSTIRIGGL